MKKILFIVALFSTFQGVKAQQLPLFSQYMNNKYVLNPAVAGTISGSSFRTVLRSQWTGLEGNPNTQTVSGHALLKKNVGLGGYIFNDKAGPLQQTGVSGSYAYHINMGAARLALGLGGLFYMYKLNTDELAFDSQGSTDLVLNRGNFSGFYPNFSFGAYYYTDKYYAGFSVPEILNNEITSSDQFYIMKQVRHYYLAGGYRFSFDRSNTYQLEPSVLMKYVKGAPTQFDVNARFIIKKMISIGASYRTNDAIVAMLGLIIDNKYHLGYSYDVTTTTLSNFQKGSHEIMLGIDLFKGKIAGNPSFR